MSDYTRAVLQGGPEQIDQIEGQPLIDVNTGQAVLNRVKSGLDFVAASLFGPEFPDRDVVVAEAEDDDFAQEAYRLKVESWEAQVPGSLNRTIDSARQTVAEQFARLNHQSILGKVALLQRPKRTSRPHGSIRRAFGVISQLGKDEDTK